jgi:hypothetical protein
MMMIMKIIFIMLASVALNSLGSQQNVFALQCLNVVLLRKRERGASPTVREGSFHMRLF